MLDSFLEERHFSFREYENVHSSVCHCSCWWLYIKCKYSNSV